MTASARSLTKRPAWEALAVHHNKVKGLHLRDLFSADHKRGERLTAEATGLFLDYSKNRVTDETLKLLVQLAEESALHERINAMFRGGGRLTSPKTARYCTWPCERQQMRPS